MTSRVVTFGLLFFLQFCLLSVSYPHARSNHHVFERNAAISRKPKGNAGYRQDISYKDWWKTGQEELKRVIIRQANLNKNVAKNVIFFVGDGMCISTETAARVLLAEKRQMSFDEGVLSWHKFPHIGMQRTYNLDRQVTDSAASATSMLCGIKARHRSIGMKADITVGNCTSSKGKEVDSILHFSLKEGKWAGIISTASVTHATPAAAYAHTPSRDWQSDDAIPVQDRHLCSDIAKQLVYNNSKIRVILGGGRRHFYPNHTADIEYPSNVTARGRRADGKDLVVEWLKNKEGKNAMYVWNETAFNAVNPSNTDYLLGLFEPYHMQYEYDRERTTGKAREPSIASLTEKAIRILQRSTKGYFLLVEGGRIDHAHHKNNAARALTETIAMHDAVERAVELTNEDDTLIVVTADHSHVFAFAGYPSLHNPILGLSDQDKGSDNLPFPVLGYYNGPGFFPNLVQNWTDIQPNVTSPRKKLTNNDTMNYEYIQPSALPRSSETHAGEDVGIYARGPMSHLFSTIHENTHIAHVMMYASCVGPNKDHCKELPKPEPVPCFGSRVQATYVTNLVVIICAIFAHHSTVF